MVARKKNETKAVSAVATAKITASANRTAQDDIWDALNLALTWGLVFIYIIIALRFAGFAANSNLHKPVAYRALIFIYTFIFAPLFAPYYIWRQIQVWIWPATALPRFEGLFPVNAYTEGKELDVRDYLFGYADTAELKAWIAAKLQTETAAKIKAVAHTVTPQDIISARAA